MKAYTIEATFVDGTKLVGKAETMKDALWQFESMKNSVGLTSVVLLSANGRCLRIINVI